MRSFFFVYIFSFYTITMPTDKQQYQNYRIDELEIGWEQKNGSDTEPFFCLANGAIHLDNASIHVYHA
ncbi:hypothetical protein ANAEL_03174 [Anaerolineales bacterium]|nr:hypothetical protein ANAEL_03174 [Anaerolineales bacterium]